MKQQFAYGVFLSHNQADKPRVRRLAERLRAAGLRVWFDEWIMQAGDDIYLAIERGLEAWRTLVLCLSPAALGSDRVTLERSTGLTDLGDRGLVCWEKKTNRYNLHSIVRSTAWGSSAILRNDRQSLSDPDPSDMHLGASSSKSHRLRQESIRPITCEHKATSVA